MKTLKHVAIILVAVAILVPGLTRAEDPPPSDLCLDQTVNCTVFWSTLISKSCWTAAPSGCCQVKVYDYQCINSPNIYRITHRYYNPFGACSGNDCL